MITEQLASRLASGPNAGLYALLRAALGELPLEEQGAASLTWRQRLGWAPRFKPIPLSDLFEVEVEISSYFDRDAFEEVETRTEHLRGARSRPDPRVGLGGMLDLGSIRGLEGAHLVGACDAGGMRWVEGLRLDLGGLGAKGLGPVVGHPAVEGLVELTLSTRRAHWEDSTLGDEGAALLGQSRLTGLVTLCVENGRFGAEGCRGLARGPSLGGLRRLELWLTEVGDAGLAELATMTLEGLICSHAEVGDAGGLAVAGSASLEGLRELRLHNNQIGDEVGAALIRAPFAERLERLDLASNRLGPKSAEALLSAGALPKLSFLRLFPNAFSDLDKSRLIERYREVLGPGQDAG